MAAPSTRVRGALAGLGFLVGCMAAHAETRLMSDPSGAFPSAMATDPGAASSAPVAASGVAAYASAAPSAEKAGVEPAGGAPPRVEASAPVPATQSGWRQLLYNLVQLGGRSR
jgi:hypothetical protein